MEMRGVANLFPKVKLPDIPCLRGVMDLLVGLENSELYLKVVQNHGNLRLLSSIFGTGYLLDRTHPSLGEDEQMTEILQKS